MVAISLKDVTEVLKMLGDAVKSTREIVKAVQDGKGYLKAKFPDAADDLALLVGQMRLTMVGLAQVTKVFTSFRFVYSGGALDHETAARDLARFNDYVIDQKVRVEELTERVSKLKANCEKVRKLRDKLDAQTKSGQWGSMFEVLGGKAAKRSRELSSSLGNFYADDKVMIECILKTLSLAERAIDEVNAELGPPGRLNPYNVPAASELLGAYATLFAPTLQDLQSLARDLESTRDALAE